MRSSVWSSSARRMSSRRHDGATSSDAAGRRRRAPWPDAPDRRPTAGAAPLPRCTSRSPGIGDARSALRSAREREDRCPSGRSSKDERSSRLSRRTGLVILSASIAFSIENREGHTRARDRQRHRALEVSPRRCRVPSRCANAVRAGVTTVTTSALGCDPHIDPIECRDASTGTRCFGRSCDEVHDSGDPL